MNATRGWSMRGALFALVVGTSVVAWLVSCFTVFRSAREEETLIHDTALEDVAHLLLQLAGKDSASTPVERALPDPAGKLAGRYRYQIWSAGGALLRASQASDHEPFAPLTQLGHQRRSIGGTDYSVFSWWSDDRTVQVQVAERADLRGLAFGHVAPSLLLVFALCTAGLVLLAAWLFGRTTRALGGTTAQLAARVAGDPHPVRVDDAPDELRPLIEEVNALCSRVAGALESERRFTAAAAHELRTPLAAVRVQAQVAERARTPADAREALAQLHVCVERASRTIDQLLTLAQFETARVAPETATRVELASLAARVVHDMHPLLRSRSIELTMNLEPVAVIGLEHGLAALLRNLVDNAARHSPPNSRMRIASGAANNEAFVAVEDSGPGIPQEERERVFERFYRLPTQNGDGVGVGLSIVRTVAGAHGGRIVLSDSELGGLRAVFFLSRVLVDGSAVDQAALAAHDAASPAPTSLPAR